MGNRNFPAKRRKDWTILLGLSTAMTADATFLGGGLSFGLSGNTILRMMGEYSIGAAVAPTANDEAVVTVGIGIVSTDAFTLGTTAVPDPTDEPEFGWLYWKSHTLFYSGTDVDSANRQQNLRQSFDVRSQRKIGARETLALIVQYTDITGAPALRFNASGARVLLALP